MQYFQTDNVDIASQGYVMLLLQVTIASDNTPYTQSNFSDQILEKLESITINKFKWFLNDAVRANPKKYHGLSSLNMSTKASVNNFDIENNTNSQKLLKITIDWKLRFHDQVSNQYKKASAKIVTMVSLHIHASDSKKTNNELLLCPNLVITCWL